MKRIYYITSHIDSADGISNDMHEAGITDWNFHVVSKDQNGLHTRHINPAHYWQQFDLVHSALRGTMIGAAAGLLMGVIVNLAAGFGWLSIPLLVLIGALFGAWLGAFIGLYHENYKIARFHDDIEAGKYLIMIDVHKDKEDLVRSLMERYHPEARMSGEDSTLINPFKGHMGQATE